MVRAALPSACGTGRSRAPVDPEAVADRDDAGGHRRRALPPGAAVDIRPLAGVQPAVDRLHGLLECLGRQMRRSRRASAASRSMPAAASALSTSGRCPGSYSPSSARFRICVTRRRCRTARRSRRAGRRRRGRHRARRRSRRTRTIGHHQIMTVSASRRRPAGEALTSHKCQIRFDLARLRLDTGEGRRIELAVAIEPFELGGERYTVEPQTRPGALDVSRTTGGGYAFRLRFDAPRDGPLHALPGRGRAAVRSRCARGLAARRGGGAGVALRRGHGLLDLGAGRATRSRSLYLRRSSADRLRGPVRGLRRRSKRRRADHEHESSPDPRWAKLSEIRFDS